MRGTSVTMHSSILRVAGLATACLALVAVPAFAHDGPAGNSFTFVGTFSDSQPFSDVVVSDYPCFDGQTGTASGVDSIEGRYNNAPPFFHFTGIESLTYRIDYPDGRYILGGSGTKMQIEANAESGSNNEKDTEVSQDHAATDAAARRGARLNACPLRPRGRSRQCETRNRPKERKGKERVGPPLPPAPQWRDAALPYGETRTRTGDTTIFSRVKLLLSL